jgi:hypothetical protein
MALRLPIAWPSRKKPEEGVFVEPLVKAIKVNWWQEGCEDGPNEISVVLRKWSGLKLLTLVRAIEEIGQALGPEFSLSKDMSPAEIARLIHSLGERSIRNAATLVAESVLKPKVLSADDVLAWDLDDFLAALTTMIEMNFSEGPRKNFARLRDAALERIFAVREATKGTVQARNSKGVPAQT